MKQVSVTRCQRLAFLLVFQKFEDTKGVTRSRTSKNDRQYNGQKKKDKGTNKDLKNTKQKTKCRVTQTPLKTRGVLRCSGRVSISCYASGTRRVTLNPRTRKGPIVIPWSFDDL